MKIVIFGATGAIGSRVLEELLSRRHQVTAVVRDPAKLAGQENVTGTSGDILDAAEVSEAARGADIVISAYGPEPDNPALLLQATSSLVKGVEDSGVRRLLTVGGAGSLEVAPGVMLLDTKDFPAEWKDIARAHGDALQILKNSSLDWTCLSPSAFIQPGERTGRYRVGKDELLTDARGKSAISFDDFALALADEVENPQNIRQRFTVAW